MVLQDIDKKVKMIRKKLSALTTGVQTCTIKVKVIRLWESINNKTDELMSLDMIFIDEKVMFEII
jgi:5S rRNA maturation endonuclease (ribonuclease M5)